MAEICLCGTSAVNTGTPDCVASPARTSRLYLVPRYGSNGTRNKILAADNVDDDYISDKLHAEDPRDRWYPITGKFARVTDVREAPITVTYDELTLNLRKSPRVWTGEILEGASQLYEAKLNSLGCSPMDAYLIDENRVLHGEDDGSGNLMGLAVQAKSFNARFISMSTDDFARISVTFTFDRTINDAKLSYISSADLGSTIMDAKGLIDVNILTVGTPTTTSLVFDAFYDYGSIKSKTPWVGADVDMITVRNLTVGDVVTVPLLTESPSIPGRYTATFSGDAQTAGDILRVESKITSNVIVSTGHEIVKTPLTAIGA
jgi:hypothetical protein